MIFYYLDLLTIIIISIYFHECGYLLVIINSSISKLVHSWQSMGLPTIGGNYPMEGFKPRQ